MSKVFSFAEESCWDGENFRSVRREIRFVLQIHGLPAPYPRRHEFKADFGIFYDPDDGWLIQILTEEVPGVDWGWLIFHKKLDHSGIIVHHPDSGKVVGSISVRRGIKQKLSGETVGGNVVPITQAGEYRARRIKREEDRAKRSRSESGPEGN